MTKLLHEQEGPTQIYCDNKSAISIAQSTVQHDRTNQVEIDRHFIKEKIDSGVVCMPFVPTTQQIADIITKGLFRPIFELFVSKLGMIDIGVVEFLGNKLGNSIFCK